MYETPSPEDFRAAVYWLESNEGDTQERLPMLRVARWLEKQAEAKELRDLAKEHGVSVDKLRTALARAGNQ